MNFHKTQKEALVTHNGSRILIVIRMDSFLFRNFFVFTGIEQRHKNTEEFKTLDTNADDLLSFEEFGKLGK